MRLQIDQARVTLRRLLAEFVVVTMGVLTALAADNWNDGRKERALGQSFRASIALDMEQNVREVERTIRQAGSHKASLMRVIAGIETGESQWSTSDAFVEDLVHCTYLGLPRLSSIAFDELRGTGSMRLLRDDQLQRRLSEYYADFEYHSQFHAEYRRKEAAVEEALLGLLPLDERIALSDRSGDAESPLGSSVDIAKWLAEMRARPQLVDRLEDMVWVQHRIATRYVRTLDESEALRQLLAHP